MSEGDQSLLDSLEHELESHFVYEKVTKMGYFLDTCYLQLGQVPVKLTGAFGLGSLRNYHLTLFSAPASFSQVLGLLLPFQIRKQLFDTYQAGGTVFLMGSYFQRHFRPSSSYFKIAVRGDSLRFQHLKTGHGFHNLALRGSMTVKKRGRERLYFIEMVRLNGFFDEYPVKGNLRIVPHAIPIVEGQIRVTIPSSSFFQFLGVKGESTGYVTLTVKGHSPSSILSSSISELAQSPLAFQFSFHQLSFWHSSISLTGLNGKAGWHGPDFFLDISAFLNKQAIELHGSMKNLIPYLLGNRTASVRGQLYLNGNAIQLDSVVTAFRGNGVPKEFSWLSALFSHVLSFEHVEVNYRFPYLRWRQVSTQLMKGKWIIQGREMHFIVDSLQSPVLFVKGFTHFQWHQQDHLTFDGVYETQVHDLYAFFIPFFSTTLPRGTSLFAESALTSRIRLRGHWNGDVDSLFLRLSLVEGRIMGPKARFEKVYLEVPIEASLSHPIYRIPLDTFSFLWNGEEQVSGSGLFPDFRKDLFHARFQASFRFATISTYLKLDRWITEPAGQVYLSMSLNAPFSSLLNRDSLQKSVTVGRTVLKDVHFRFKQGPFHFSHLQGEISYTQDSILVHELSGRLNGSDSFSVSGGVKYFLRFISEYPRAPLIGYFDLFLDTLHLNAFTTFSEEKLPKWSPKEGWIFLPLLPPKNQVTLKLFCQSLLVNGEIFKGVFLLVRGQDERLQIAHASGFALGGRFFVEGEVIYMPPVTDLQFAFQLKGIQIDRLLAMFHNFRQNFLTSDNVRGDVYAEGTLTNRILNGKWDWMRTDLGFDLSMLHGQLRNFALAKPFQIEDSSYFIAEISRFHMWNGVIHIPFFRILSDQIHLEGKGWHTIRLNYVYHVALYAPGKLPQLPSNNPFRYFTLLHFRLKGHGKQFFIEYDLKTSILDLFSLLYSFFG
jgi:hypothetical protein